jgi:hypothetical protein
LRRWSGPATIAPCVEGAARSRPRSPSSEKKAILIMSTLMEIRAEVREIRLLLEEDDGREGEEEAGAG